MDHSASIQYVLAAIQQIVPFNIPLAQLSLTRLRGSSHSADELVDGIIKMKELEGLTCVRNHCLTIPHIYKFCEYLPNLRALSLDINAETTLTLEDITKWIRAADKLETLSIDYLGSSTMRELIVDRATYKEWREIVENRRDKTHLFLSLEPSFSFEAKLTPADAS